MVGQTEKVIRLRQGNSVVNSADPLTASLPCAFANQKLLCVAENHVMRTSQRPCIGRACRQWNLARATNSSVDTTNVYRTFPVHSAISYPCKEIMALSCPTDQRHCFDYKQSCCVTSKIIRHHHEKAWPSRYVTTDRP